MLQLSGPAILRVNAADWEMGTTAREPRRELSAKGRRGPVVGAKTIGALSCLLLLLCCREATAAPRQLYGKSIVVSWVENRVQRVAGEAKWRPVNIQVGESVYVSTIGRLFSRMTFAARRGSGAREQVGESGRSSTGGKRVMQFRGHALVTVAVFNGGARHIRIDFDAEFSGCSASVILGRAADAGTFTLRSAITGVPIEVQSQSASGATCSITNGNVFAE
jgi:hypothetical protein